VRSIQTDKLIYEKRKNPRGNHTIRKGEGSKKKQGLANRKGGGAPLGWNNASGDLKGKTSEKKEKGGKEKNKEFGANKQDTGAPTPVVTKKSASPPKRTATNTKPQGGKEKKSKKSPQTSNRRGRTGRCSK